MTRVSKDSNKMLKSRKTSTKPRKWLTVSIKSAIEELAAVKVSIQKKETTQETFDVLFKTLFPNGMDAREAAFLDSQVKRLLGAE